MTNTVKWCSGGDFCVIVDVMELEPVLPSRLLTTHAIQYWSSAHEEEEMIYVQLSDKERLALMYLPRCISARDFTVVDVKA